MGQNYLRFTTGVRYEKCINRNDGKQTHYTHVIFVTVELFVVFNSFARWSVFLFPISI